MLLNFFKHTLIYSFSNILSKFISLLLIPFYTHVFKPAEFGILDVNNLFTTLIILTVPLEISQGLGRYLPETESEEEVRAYSSTALNLSIINYFIFLIFCGFFGNEIGLYLYGSQEYVYIFYYLLLLTFFRGLYIFLINQIRWMLKAKEHLIVTNFYTFISIFNSALLVLVLKQGLAGILCAEILSLIMASILAWWFSKSHYHFQFDIEKCKELLIFSLPLVISSIGVYIARFTDRFMIKELLNIHELGLYSIGVLFTSPISLIISATQTAIVPLIYKHYKENNFPKVMNQILMMYLSVSLSAIIGCILFSKEILYIFTQPDYYSAYIITPIYSASIIAASFYIFSPGLTIAKNTKMVTIINLSGAILNIILNYIFIIYWGILGVTLATLISALVTFCAYNYYSENYIPLNYQWNRIVLVSIFSLGLSYICLYFEPQTFLSISMLIVKIVFFISITLFLMFTLIGFKSVKEHIQKLLALYQ